MNETTRVMLTAQTQSGVAVSVTAENCDAMKAANEAVTAWNIIAKELEAGEAEASAEKREG